MCSPCVKQRKSGVRPGVCTALGLGRTNYGFCETVFAAYFVDSHFR
uniref:Uncharacterized protein n=1 Tax=Anopheles minimus TaxID=112268 RepID=A0A182WQ14_9DIPT